MEEKILSVVSTLNSYLADYVLIFLLIGVGLFFSVRTRFVQVRCFGDGMRQVFGGLSLNGKKEKGGLSSFQALATAVAAQVGTGNIVGACGAILIGGPGAIFWMWIIAFLGMATIYSEAILAQKTRIVNPDGSVKGGPAYYIRTAFTGRFGKILAGFFAVAAILALGFMGSMVQSNSIAESCYNAFGIPTWISGAFVAVVAAFIFIGGVSRIASVTEKLVPLMATLYLLGGFAVIFANITVLPEAFGMIFRYAFAPEALLGGSFGAAFKIAVSQGAKRGLFSNEAGMGSTPHAHALAKVKDPHEQGIAAMIGVFIDTFVVLTMTALVVITTLYAGNGPLADYAAKPAEISKTNMAQLAFSSLFGDGFGGAFVAVCLLFFAFSTIIGWNLFGKLNVEYLFPKHKKTAVLTYSVLAIAFIVLGSLLQNDLVWELTDSVNYLMVIPNVLAMLFLFKLVPAVKRQRSGGSPSENP